MRAMDLHNNVNLKTAIAPQATTSNTAITSSIIDTQGYESVEFALQAGALYAGSAFTVSLAEGNASDMSDGTAVASSNLLGTLTLAGISQAAGDANKVKKLGYIGMKRYLQLTVTPTGNGATSYLSAVAILGSPHNAPTSNPPA